MKQVQPVGRASVGLLVAALGAGAGCSGPREMLDVAYDDRFGDSTTMDVYLPDGDATGRPAIMFIHGGAWSAGSKDAYTAAAQRFARSGYVTATSESRLLPEGRFPKNAQECLCALSWLRGHADAYGLDPTRIAVLGYSAGGHLASLVGVAGERSELAPDCAAGPTAPPAAVVSGAGPQDLRDSDASVVEDLLGGSESAIPETYALASPMAQVGSGEPPFLLFHGDGDWIVPVEQSRDMRDALVAAGNRAELLELGGVGHLVSAGTDVGSIQVFPDRPEVWLAVVDFLESTIGAP